MRCVNVTDLRRNYFYVDKSSAYIGRWCYLHGGIKKRSCASSAI